MSNKKSKSEIDQDAFDKRINKGILPTVEINNHIFYVDLSMDKLRPKDDFASDGINFAEIEDYYNEERDIYIIPYIPKTKGTGHIDYETITQIPQDQIVIELPPKEILDPIGWNRLHGYDLSMGLKNKKVQMNFKAKTAKWDDIYVPEKIKENLEIFKNSSKENVKQKTTGSKDSKIIKGRKI